MYLQLTDKIIIVTGGAKGIGEGISKVLAQSNCIGAGYTFFGFGNFPFCETYFHLTIVWNGKWGLYECFSEFQLLPVTIFRQRNIHFYVGIAQVTK